MCCKLASVPDIELRLITAPYLPTVLADRGQIEQVLVNLALNARDAMPEGGILTFTTGTADLSEAPGAVPSGTRPGLSPRLTVSDTGRGMETARRRCPVPSSPSSPPGRRARAPAWEFPRSTASSPRPAAASPSTPRRAGYHRPHLPARDLRPGPGLGADEIAGHRPDHPGGRRPARGARGSLAARCATTAITRSEPGSYDEALSLLATHDPDLLLTDSVLAEVPEQTLADRVREIRPGMRILRMSGAHIAALAPERGQVISKPFTAKDLVQKVRAILAVPPEY